MNPRFPSFLAFQLPLAAMIAMTGCSSSRPQMTLDHHIKVPKQFAAGAENPIFPENSKIERYVTAYDRAWWTAVQSYTENIDFVPAPVYSVSGWPEEVAGAAAGYATACERISALRKRFGKRSVSTYLQEFRLQDSASNAEEISGKGPVIESDGVRYQLGEVISVQQKIRDRMSKRTALDSTLDAIQKKFPDGKELADYIEKMRVRWNKSATEDISDLEKIQRQLDATSGQLWDYEARIKTGIEEGYIIVANGKLVKKYPLALQTSDPPCLNNPPPQ